MGKVTVQWCFSFFPRSSNYLLLNQQIFFDMKGKCNKNQKYFVISKTKQNTVFESFNSFEYFCFFSSVMKCFSFFGCL